MSGFHRFTLFIERCLHPKIKEGIAKSLVYYFSVKETWTYQQSAYQGQPHLLDRLLARKQLLRVAHRGFSGAYPENTLLAFEKALAAGCDLLELDVQLSQDGELVVCHDPHLLRLSGQPHFVRDLPYAQLRSLDVGAWKAAAHAGQHIPTLAEVFASLPPDSCLLIEVKHEATRFLNWELEKKLLQTIQAHGRSQQVVLAAFNPMVVNRLRKLAPQISTLYLLTQTLNPLLIWLLSRLQPRYLAVDMRYLNPRVVAALQDKGLGVLGYTLNSHADFATGWQLGLAGMITDYPDRLMAFLAEQHQPRLPPPASPLN